MVDDTPPACPIKNIPLEVLLRITYWLPTPDLGNMRLTCRAIEKMLYNSFAEEFFSRKQFMLSFFSLHTLIEISKSRMSVHLRRLQIGTDRFEAPSWGQLRDPEAVDTYASQCELLATGLHRDLLTEALRNLENLEDVVIRDFNSNRRTRDGLNVEWQSYGASTAKRHRGLTVRMADRVDLHPHKHFPALVFNSLLTSLGDSGVQPKGVEIMMRNRSNLSDYAFCITPSLRPNLISMLGKLEKLHLAIDYSHSSYVAFNPDNIDKLQKWNNLARFLTHTPNLKDLRINETHTFNDGLTSFMDWLAKPSSTTPGSGGDGRPDPITLPHLEELSLGQMTIVSSLLCKVIKKFAPTLRSLELWRVSLVWDRPADEADGDPAYPWKHFLSSLMSKEGGDLTLHHFKVGCMEQLKHDKGSDGPTFDHRQICFKGKEATRTYTGIDWRNFVKEIIPNLELRPNYRRRERSISDQSDSTDYTHMPGAYEESEESEESEEDDDDEDDEDMD